MSNVIDLSARRPPKTPSEILDDLRERSRLQAQRTAEALATYKAGMADLDARARDGERWEHWERSWLRQRVRRLEDQLRAERRGQFDDDGVYAAAVALAEETSGDRSFAATAVALRLLRCPSHSAVVRVGLCLSRLEKAGRVERIPPPPSEPHRPNRWRLGGVDDA